MQKRRTLLFLYTRLPDYFYRCIEHFVHSSDYDVVVVRHRDDPNTKYSFKPNERIKLIFKADLNLGNFIADLQPRAIILSGWSDKSYTKAASYYKAKIPIVLAMDNPWTGTWKQKVLITVAAFSIRKIFNAAWVTGVAQHEYASRLGFKRSEIIKDLYAADCNKFYTDAASTAFRKKEKFPHNLVYVGRLVEYKQPDVLAEVFQELIDKSGFDWKLIIAGEGPLKERIREKGYKNVEVIDFVSPTDLPGFYVNAGIFVLPSKGEHWGVAVHEAAAAGLPLLLSDTVEAASQFLIPGFNGYKFSTGSRESLKLYLSRLMATPDTALYEMGQKSVLLSKTISHETWTANLNSILIDSQ